MSGVVSEIGLRAVILAAGEGTRLRPMTLDVPKCLVEVAGMPLLGRMMDPLVEAGVEEIVVVTGYLSEKVDEYLKRVQRRVPCKTVYNPRFNTANNYYSLLVAEDVLKGAPFLKVDGDVIFESKVITHVLNGVGGIRLGVDFREDLGQEEMKVRMDGEGRKGRVAELSKAVAPKAAHGESMGIEYISEESGEELFKELHRMAEQGLDNEYYEFAYDRLARKGHDVRAVDISGFRSTEIDDIQDLKRAEALFKKSCRDD